MCHAEQKHFFQEVKNQFPIFFINSKVLEIGSLDINGSIRDCFETPTEYIGVDLEEGPGVDFVGEGQKIEFSDEYFDCTLSSECFEHNPYWLETFVNMVRMTRQGGLVTFSCASEGRPEHGTTRTNPLDSPFTVNKGWDYYRNLNEVDFTSVLDFDGLFTEYNFQYNSAIKDLYFWGIKK